MTDMTFESGDVAELNPMRSAGLKLTPSVPVGGVGDTEEVKEMTSEPVPPATHVAVATLIGASPSAAIMLPCVDDSARLKLNGSIICSE